MANIAPFGSSDAVGNPNLNKQVHFGASLKNFSVQADWSSQGGKLSMSLIEDDTGGDQFTVPVINSPYFFQFDNFTYGGLVDSIHRSISNASSKEYSVELSSPNKLLSNVNVILDGYAGFGGSTEGVPYGMSEDGYYSLPSGLNIDAYSPSGIETTNSNSYLRYDTVSFGTNNNSGDVDWSTNYNIINVFGAYENDQYYQFPNYKGYGAAGVNAGGMRFDRLVPAMHELINHTSSSDGQRYLGGNILYGANSYNLTSSVTPYYFGFDVLDFYNQVSGVLPKDFRIPSNNGVTSALDVVDYVCSEINYDYMLVLDSGTSLSSDNTSIQQTYPNTNYGGFIKVRAFSKNQPLNSSRPYSQLSATLLNLEIPDVGDYSTSNVNPGVQPTGYLDPMQDDYTNVGTEGSSPYGGKFPVATSGDYSSGTNVVSRIKSGSMSIQSTDQTAYRVVVGAPQSRIVYAGQDYIYHYWGDVEFVDSDLPSSGVRESSKRKVPVITPPLHDNDVNDFILVDTQSIFGNDDLSQTVRKGIYVASLLEIRAAMGSYDAWISFMGTFKPEKIAGLYGYAFKKKYPGAFTTAVVPAYNVLGMWCEADEMDYEVFIQKEHVLDADAGPVVVRMGRNNISTGILKGHNKTRRIRRRPDRPDTTDSNSEKRANAERYYYQILSDLHSKIKNVGDNHYGKSWCTPLPYVNSKLTSDNVGIVGNVEKSWDITDGAYLEPYAFDNFSAPRSRLFVEGGLVKPYVNYDYAFTAASLTGIFSDFVIPSDGTYTYDFSEYNAESMVYDSGVAHVVPQMDTDYVFVPSDYFNNYDRSKIPVSRIADNSVWTASITGPSGVAGLNNFSADVPKDKAVVISDSGSWHVDDLGVRMDQMQSVIDNFSIVGSGTNDYGLNMLHMVKFNTSRVFYPTKDDKNLDYDAPNIVEALLTGGRSVDFNMPQVNQKSVQKNLFSSLQSMEFFPAVVKPIGVGIPQKSNRHRYGPWTTNFNKRFAGKVEYIVDDSLAPENNIIPLHGTIPTGISFTLDESLSGTAGMNLAGQAIANSIDNSSLFADEQATITLPEAPSISNIGDALILDSTTIAPYITDMSVRITEQEIETTYNFRTYSPRNNRTNRDIINRVRSISNDVKRLYNK